MQFQVTFAFEADTPEDAHEQISQWVVTPGSILMHVTHNPPRVVHQPFVVESGAVADHIPAFEDASAPPLPLVPPTGEEPQPFAAPVGHPLPPVPNGGTP
jgi:hypothetical protein